MIIISEKLNSSIPSSKKLMENGTDEEIRAFIGLQCESGASYLDLNAAMCSDEINTAKRIADLIIDPAPDSLLRVYMVAKPLDSFTKIEPQVFDGFVRDGFTVVEWGGSIIQ